MSGNAETRQTGSREAKRGRFAQEEAKRPSGASPWILVAALLVVLAILGGSIWFLTRPAPVQSAAPAEPASFPVSSQGLAVQAATFGHDPYPAVGAEGGVLRLALSTFDDGRAHFYTYLHEGRPIEFFVLKSQDGVVRAALNACDVCFAAKLGYRQEGDTMVCNNCGNRFPSNQINEVRGGCNPSPLERTVEGDSLVIRVEDLVAGQRYF